MRVTQICLAEAFQIHSLDFQARVHIAEKVMRSLNGHTEAGHTIPIPSNPLTNLVSAGEILAINQDEMNEPIERKEEKEVYQCAKSVALFYKGKPCMGTCIHGRVPNSLITNIWLNVVWHSLYCRMHLMHLLEVVTLNISKSFSPSIIMFMMVVWKALEVRARKRERSVTFMQLLKVQNSLVLMVGVISW